MKTIRNKTTRPLKVSLPGGKVLYLGPRKDGQIADNAAERPSVQRLVESGDVEIVGGPSSEASGGSAGNISAPGSSQGHAKSPASHRQGNRGQ